MLKEIRNKAREIAKQAIEVQKTREVYEEDPMSMKNGIKHFDAIGKLLQLTSELTEMNVKLVAETNGSMRKSRIKRNVKDLGYSDE